MVNIAKLAGMAANQLLKNPKALAVGASIAGLSIGIPIGQSFSEDKVGDEFEKSLKTEVKADTTKVTKPEVKEAEAKFQYQPPKIGEDGIVKADTSYWLRDGKVAKISYLNKDNKEIRTEHFDENGKLKSYTCYVQTVEGGYIKSTYNLKGELIEQEEKDKKGNTEEFKLGEHGNWLIQKFDSKGRVTQYETEEHITDGRYGTRTISYTYHPNGSYTIFKENDHKKTTYDKNGNVINEKQYDSTGKLEYTVVPKYNKDGDLVKRDTIRNK